MRKLEPVIKEVIREAPEIITAEQYSRLKGAVWFPLLQKKTVLVLGQGGIGSWLTLFLARAGVKKLVTYDMDTFEGHNMTGQFVEESSVGTLKVTAVKDLVLKLSPTTVISAYAKEYTESEPTSLIVICGFDNMKARKAAFIKWKEMVDTLHVDDRKFCFFQDGRLLSEQLQIFNIPGNKPELMEKYEKEFLFDDSEVGEVDCTFKQTSHCAAMIASHMTGFLTNYISSVEAGVFRKIPFYYEYIVSINKIDKHD